MDCAPDQRGLAGWPIRNPCGPVVLKRKQPPIGRRVKFGGRLSAEVHVDALEVFRDLDNSVRSGSKDRGPEVGDSMMTNTALSPAKPVDFPARYGGPARPAFEQRHRVHRERARRART